MKQRIADGLIVERCWCGMRVQLIDLNSVDMWKVICDNDHVATQDFASKQKAVKGWNRQMKWLRNYRDKKEKENEVS